MIQQRLKIEDIEDVEEVEEILHTQTLEDIPEELPHKQNIEEDLANLLERVGLNDQYVCVFCNFSYKSEGWLKNHISERHDKCENTYQIFKR